jgi:hypothetical protein
MLQGRLSEMRNRICSGVMSKQDVEQDKRDSKNKEEGTETQIAGALYVWWANV